MCLNVAFHEKKYSIQMAVTMDGEAIKRVFLVMDRRRGEETFSLCLSRHLFLSTLSLSSPFMETISVSGLTALAQ